MCRIIADEQGTHRTRARRAFRPRHTRQAAIGSSSEGTQPGWQRQFVAPKRKHCIAQDDRRRLTEMSPLDFKALGLTVKDVAEIVAERPSLRGMIMGYAAEYKVRRMWFTTPPCSKVFRPDDHDRTQHYDMRFEYKGVTICVECKSVKGDTVKPVPGVPGSFVGMVQCRGSDRREIVLPGGDKYVCTNLRVGDFDLLSVNLFPFVGEWRFAFARNSELPTAKWGKHPEWVRDQLLPNFIPITWPLAPPFIDSPWPILDAIVADRMRGKSARRFDEH